MHKLFDGVSVVIVTFNGKTRLLPTLEHLANQEEISFDWEVLLIDNNSTDGTSEFAQDYWKEKDRTCDLRIYLESKRGTLFARKAGFEQAKYRYVLFCDDDNSFSPKYVKTAYDYISSNANIAAVGGKGIPKFEPGIRPPIWAEPYLRFLGCGPQGDKTGDTTFVKGCLYTAGAIIDNEWIRKLISTGFEPKLTGRIGNSLVAGEDTELTYALKAMGGGLHYCEEMEFYHLIPENRLTLDYFKRLYKAMGYSDFILQYYYSNRKNIICTWLICTLSIIKHFLSINLFNSGDENQKLLYLQKQLGRWQAHVSIFNNDIPTAV